MSDRHAHDHRSTTSATMRRSTGRSSAVRVALAMAFLLAGTPRAALAAEVDAPDVALAHPDSPAADLVREAVEHANAGRAREAHAVALRAIERDPSSSDAYDVLGAALLLEQKYEEALAAHARAAELAPGSPDPHLNSVPSLRALGREEDALAAARTAVRLAPACGHCQIALAVSLVTLRELDEATAVGREAVRLVPELPGAHVALGMALLYARSFADAAPVFEEAVRLTSGGSPTRLKMNADFGLAIARLALGEHVAATTAFRRVLEYEPRHVEARVHLGDALARQRDVAGAVSEYEQAASIASQEPSIRFRLGQAYLSLGRTADAIAQLERLVADRPDHALGRATLVVAYRSHGRATDAERQLEELRTIDPVLADRLPPSAEYCEPRDPEA